MMMVSIGPEGAPPEEHDVFGSANSIEAAQDEYARRRGYRSWREAHEAGEFANIRIATFTIHDMPTGEPTAEELAEFHSAFSELADIDAKLPSLLRREQSMLRALEAGGPVDFRATREELERVQGEIAALHARKRGILADERAPSAEGGQPAEPSKAEPRLAMSGWVSTLEQTPTEQESGEPPMQVGVNPRAQAERWVAWCARNLREVDDDRGKLVERIRLRAERWGYRSERSPFTDASITRMLPPGLFGPRGRKRGSQTRKKFGTPS